MIQHWELYYTFNLILNHFRDMPSLSTVYNLKLFESIHILFSDMGNVDSLPLHSQATSTLRVITGDFERAVRMIESMFELTVMPTLDAVSSFRI